MAIVIAVICHYILGVSKRGCDLILSMICFLLFKAFGYSESVQKPQDHLISDIPASIDRALPTLGLEGRTITYAVCPIATYPPSCPLKALNLRQPSFARVSFVCDHTF